MRHFVTGKRTRSIAGVLAFFPAIAIGIACGEVTERQCALNSDPSRLGLCIDHMTTSVVDGRDIAIEAQIVNVKETPLVGKTWWVVAPQGPGLPWDRAVFISRVFVNSYGAHSRVILNWATRVDLPSATYDLALIVHLLNPDGSETHVESRGVGPIRIAAPLTEPWLIRHQEGPGPVLISSASGPQAGAGGSDRFSRTVTMANSAKVRVDSSIWMEARAPLAGWENLWWMNKTLFSTPPVRFQLDSGQSMTLPIVAVPPATLFSTFPNVQIWLVVSTNGAAADEVLLGGPSTFTAPSDRIARHFYPVGPVELAGIDDQIAWNHRAPHTVILTIVNLTGNTQLVQASWYLSVASAPQPWIKAAVASAQIQTALGPFGTKALAVSATQIPPTGQWELSGWVLSGQGSRSLVQSDALWLASAVVVN